MGWLGAMLIAGLSLSNWAYWTVYRISVVVSHNKFFANSETKGRLKAGDAWSNSARSVSQPLLQGLDHLSWRDHRKWVGAYYRRADYRGLIIATTSDPTCKTYLHKFHGKQLPPPHELAIRDHPPSVSVSLKMGGRTSWWPLRYSAIITLGCRRRIENFAFSQKSWIQNGINTSTSTVRRVLLHLFVL